MRGSERITGCFYIASLITLMVIVPVAAVVAMGELSPSWFEPAEVTVWAWVAGLYHLFMGALRVFCPGALLLLVGMVALNKWAKSREAKDA